MLKKLMKYEFKSTGRAFLPVYGALLASALMTRLMMWGDNISALNNAFLYNLISGLVVVLFVAMLVATFVVTLMVVLQRFSKNLLGEEGYLSMTLPVKPYQHILSKSIVAVFWYFASWIAAVLSFMVLMWNRHIFRDILRAVTFLFTEIQWDWQSVLLIAELFLLAVVSIFCAVQPFSGAAEPPQPQAGLLRLFSGSEPGQRVYHRRRQPDFFHFPSHPFSESFFWRSDFGLVPHFPDRPVFRRLFLYFQLYAVSQAELGIAQANANPRPVGRGRFFYDWLLL